MLMCLLSERCVVERERERERDSPSIRRAHAEVVDEAFFLEARFRWEWCMQYICDVLDQTSV
jgi:hypothetical protein